VTARGPAFGSSGRGCYGGYGDAWDEAVEQARVTLYRWAAEGKPRTYTDLAREVTAIPWPEDAFTHSGQQIGMLLGQVSLNELVRDEDRPVLSSIVVGGDEHVPTRGYWTFVRTELGIPVPRSDLGQLEHWQAEFAAACAYYGPKATSA
jgi:hypothetical protein